MGARDLIFAVDGGGTSSNAVLYDKAGFERRSAKVGPMSCKSSDVEVVAESIRGLKSFLADDGEQVLSCVFALSGLDDARDVTRMVSLLSEGGFFGESPEIRQSQFFTSVMTFWGFPLILCSDALLPLFANYFTSGSVVIAGTGSIAINLSRLGTVRRYGGWGYAVSDEGSGTWVGSMFLRRALQACDQAMSDIDEPDQIADDDKALIDLACKVIFPRPADVNTTDDLLAKISQIESWSIKNCDPKSYASLAKSILELAYNEEVGACLDIAHDAASKLAGIASLAFSEDSPFIVLSGALFRCDGFACEVKDLIYKLTNGRATTITNTKSPTLGALRIVSYVEGA